MLHPIAAFLSSTPPSIDRPPTYWYEGRCLRTGECLRLPRTAFVEAIAQGLMRQLGDRAEFQAGKMYGVLLVETPGGDRGVLKAFSGLLNGKGTFSGWVPPIEGRDRVALSEAQTLAELEAIKQELICLQTIPQRQQYEARSQFWQQQLDELSLSQQQRKQIRQAKRDILQATLKGDELAQVLEILNNESRRDKSDRRQLKQQREAELNPLKQIIDNADARTIDLKQQRKVRSRDLQTQLFTAHQLTNFAGETVSLDALMPQGYLPTGTGECCAPKLLHYAATHDLKPIALAEFWWGTPSPDGEKLPGQFYGACSDRCQPIMGFLLSGLSQRVLGGMRPANRATLGGAEPMQSVLLRKTVLTIQSPPFMGDLGGIQDLGSVQGLRSNAGTVPLLQPPLTILYEDDYLIAIDKPPNLLSVPGRYSDRQDSVLSRLMGSREAGEQRSRGAEEQGESEAFNPPLTPSSPHLLISSSTHPPIHPSTLLPVHRLDQDTSGVMLLAKDRKSYRKLAEQFQRRQVRKIYEAMLDGLLEPDEGTIDLPLSSDPENRPYQKVDWQRGKPSLTKFRVIERSPTQTRVELYPLTGRTHQLRVHTAIGLNLPIVGDRLYGRNSGTERLYLHARELQIWHPRSGCCLQIKANLPF